MDFFSEHQNRCRLGERLLLASELLLELLYPLVVGRTAAWLLLGLRAEPFESLLPESCQVGLVESLSPQQSAEARASPAAAALSTTRSFSSGVHRFPGRFFSSSFDIPLSFASRSHRDNVGCERPTSFAITFADCAPGPSMRAIIRFLNLSLYSNFVCLRAPREIHSGTRGNYPDAGG